MVAEAKKQQEEMEKKDKEKMMMEEESKKMMEGMWVKNLQLFKPPKAIILNAFVNI